MLNINRQKKKKNNWGKRERGRKHFEGGRLIFLTKFNFFVFLK